MAPFLLGSLSCSTGGISVPGVFACRGAQVADLESQGVKERGKTYPLHECLMSLSHCLVTTHQVPHTVTCQYWIRTLFHKPHSYYSYNKGHVCLSIFFLSPFLSFLLSFPLPHSFEATSYYTVQPRLETQGY